MHLGMLLAMASEAMNDRCAVGSRDGGLTYGDLAERAFRLGTYLAGLPGERVAMVDVNSPAVPISLFGAAAARKPFAPINYRLSDDRLRALVARTAPAVLIMGPGVAERIGPIDGITAVSREEVFAAGSDSTIPLADPWAGDPDDIAVLLFTSGTTADPKAAVLRHRHLAAYVISSVEFMGAEPTECTLVSVPPYHVAAISAVLSSTYAGRRVAYLESFDAAAWVERAAREHISHAMVVPTMLDRILDIIDPGGPDPHSPKAGRADTGDVADPHLPALRHLSYGGGPMPVAVIERALRLLPNVGFVNSYGLTETSSTVAILGPEEHRRALASEDPGQRARLGSVGRPLPALEVSIRDANGVAVPGGETGEIWVRGDQVAGEYLGGAGGLPDGWFATRDGGHIDAEGYLFVHGRLDDVIVRGGENVSPAEIETALLSHPAVVEAAVVGIPDRQWGEAIAAAVVVRAGATVTDEELKAHVRHRLRSTMTPAVIEIRDTLPFNETGKLLRRVLRAELATTQVPRQVADDALGAHGG